MALFSYHRSAGEGILGALGRGGSPGGTKGISWLKQEKGWGCQFYRGFHGASLSCEQRGAVFQQFSEHK